MDTKHIRLLTAFALVGSSLALVACGDDGPAGPDSGTVDSGPSGEDAGGDEDAGEDEDGGPIPTTGCAAYCTQTTANCTGENAQYDDMADCMAYCEASGWPEGTAGATSGNSIQCRIYHGGVPAMSNPSEHCPHAGPSGAATCGTVDFRTDAAATYARVDRMGMPAVSTALIAAARKNAYNDANPADDADGDFVTDLGTSLTGIHAVLDDDLTTLTFDQCSMLPVPGGLPECFTQEVAPGVSVASLVVPDTLQINPAAPAGFPNGRMLADPVIDVTLAVILLDLEGTCGAAPCSPGTFAALPLNPPENDLAEGEPLPAFPYLHPPHAP